MRYNTLGQSGLFVSELCLGTMTFGGGEGMWSQIGTLQQTEADELVAAALDAGINFIDTANVYAEGLLRADHRPGAAQPRHRARRGRRRHQGLRPHGRGAQRRRRLARSHPRPGQGQPEAAAARPYRPLPDPRLRLRSRRSRRRWRRSTPSCATGMCAMSASPTGPPGRSPRRRASPTSAASRRFASLQAYYTLAGRDLEREIVPMLTSEASRADGVEPARRRPALGQIRPRATPPAATAAGRPSTSRRSTASAPTTVIDAMRPIAEAHGARWRRSRSPGCCTSRS